MTTYVVMGVGASGLPFVIMVTHSFEEAEATVKNFLDKGFQAAYELIDVD